MLCCAVLCCAVIAGVHEKGKADRSGDLAAFQALGNEVLSAIYESKISSYVYDKPDEIKVSSFITFCYFASYLPILWFAHIFCIKTYIL